MSRVRPVNAGEMSPGRGWLLLAGLVLAAGVPVLILAVYAVAPGWSFPEIAPARFTWRAVRGLYEQRSGLLLGLGSSALYSLAVVGTSVLLTLAPAKALARRDFPGKVLVEGLSLAPALVPAVAWSLGAHHLLIRLGLADTWPGVVLILTVAAGPYMLRALIAGYQSFGPELEQCAANLGASPWRVFRSVELPLLVPALIAGSSVVFLVAFSEYFLVFLIGGGRVPSFTGWLFPFLTSSDRASAAVLTLIFLAVPIALFVLIEFSLAASYRRRGVY